jgi:DNA-binding HxlR family transcriptional regulator
MSLVVPDVLEEGCTTRQALERLASKWRILLIYALLAGPNGTPSSVAASRG